MTEPQAQTSPLIVLSYLQAKLMLKAKQAGALSAQISTNLGLTQAQVNFYPDFVCFANREQLAWQTVAEIADNQLVCFYVEDNIAIPSAGFPTSLAARTV